jgi:peroxin-4
MTWEAVINGHGVGHGYDGKSLCPPPIPFFFLLLKTRHKKTHSLAKTKQKTGGRWLISISLPEEYPLRPPKMRFTTQIVHPNIALQDGEICLDLLKDAWTPTYSVLECVRAVRMLLSCPETDSPLNVDVAALLRGGDVLGTRRLVEFWCADEAGRYDGP